jgi:hypothetical protein
MMLEVEVDAGIIDPFSFRNCRPKSSLVADAGCFDFLFRAFSRVCFRLALAGIYGVLQARLLRDLLGQVAGEPDPISALQARFMAQVATILQSPWSMSTSADLAFPATCGQRPEKFEEDRRFEAALFRAVVADPAVHRTFIEVLSLLKPLSRLQEPDILRRIEAVSPSKAA